MNLSGLDLNLLVLLEALFEEKSVTRAGIRVGLSQPAASHGLRRLRHLLGDPLLEKDGRRLRLSPRAHQLNGPLKAVLDQLRGVLEAPPLFEPAVSPLKVRLFASDHIAFVLLPLLSERMTREAPLAEITVHWTRGDEALHLLEDGRVDAAIGRYTNTTDAICRTRLYDEVLVVQARKGHPIFDRPLTAAEFVRYPRIATSFDGRLFGDQEQAIARAGMAVRSRIVLPHLVAAPMLTLENDMITITPRRLAERLSRLTTLEWRPLPFEAAPVPIEMVWHERTTADPALSWFRELAVSVGGLV